MQDHAQTFDLARVLFDQVIPPVLNASIAKAMHIPLGNCPDGVRQRAVVSANHGQALRVILLETGLDQ